MANRYKHSKDVYFATIEDPVELASAILGKIETWRGWITSNGLIDNWKRKYINYYGRSQNGNSSQMVTQGGSEGELSMIKVNDLRQLLQSQLVMVTGERPAGIAQPSNSDTASLKASGIGSAVAEYYMHAEGFEPVYIQTTEIALLLDEGFCEIIWDKNIGQDVVLNEDQTTALKSGDGRISAHTSWNVARDPSANSKDQKWHIVTFKVNKFDYAKLYPDFAQQIIQAKENTVTDLSIDPINEGSDQVFAHRLIHDKTPSVPQGRYTLVIGDTVIEDGPLLFDFYPLDRITPSDVINGCLGYSSSNDIMGMEQITDALYSAITSNQINFAVQNIIGPIGGNLNVVDLAKGVRYLEVDPALVDKVKALVLASTPPEVFNFIQMLTAKKDNMVGANSVTKGQPEGKLAGASGAALALLQAQAISYNSGIQSAFYKLISSSMTKFIKLLQQNMSEAKLIQIVGKVQMHGIKEFKITGEQLKGVSAIVYTPVDPLSQTVGGKLALADNLLQKDMIQSPKQYLTVAKTGNLDPMTQDSETIQMTILEENELLKSGQQVDVVVTENHADHIRSHDALLTPEVKKDPTIAGIITEHIQMHVNQWTEASINNPAILVATGQQILQPGMGLPMGPPPQQNNMAAQDPNAAPEVLNEKPPQQELQEDVNLPNLPNLPNIAGTQEKPVIPGVTQ